MFLVNLDIIGSLDQANIHNQYQKNHTKKSKSKYK